MGQTGTMQTTILLVIAALAARDGSAYADSELVIAIRYLEAEATSHSYLDLYPEDGKLLRQLRNYNSRQDSAPMFSRDGTDASGHSSAWNFGVKQNLL
jgi:hypothetical protein